MGVGWGPPACEEVRTACAWVWLCQQGYGVCLYRVCVWGGGVTNTYKEKADLLSKPLSILKLLSKPGNNCQAAIHFLLGGGKSRPSGRVTTASDLQGSQSHLHCWAHLPRTGLLGPLLSAGTFLATIHSLGAEGGASYFHLGRNNFCPIFILHQGKLPQNREKM